ncbi:MAG TPA: nucleotidyltransferase family protein [Anaerolineales bacterium]|nr:nucleotidyltransferase family protein [Anaerolineales bacterium]
MTPEDFVLCLCTRQSFETEHQQNLIDFCWNQTIHWDIVLETANKHQITPIVYTNLTKIPDKNLNIPLRVQDRFKKTQIHNIFTKQRTEAALEKVLALFNQKGIDVMLVKGGAVAYLVYDRPWYTICLDMDLVIRVREDELTEDDRREIFDLLESFNRERSPFKEHIEYDFYAHHDITMNNILPVDWERIWADAEKIQIKGYDVFVMTPEDTLLATAITSCRKRFFRLKSLCDLATIIEKYPALDWNTVISKAHEHKCNTILYTALIVTQSTLGCHLPDNILTELRVPGLRAILIRFLVKNLSQRISLMDLFVHSGNATYNRTLSWPLFLTYATYRVDLLWPKLGELYSAWRNPPPPVPG